MKNRRSTIIVAIMVTLVGTPRVWKEFGDILASLQHKTQNRLLSMVVNSQVRESSEEELAGTPPQSEYLASSSCPAAKLYQGTDNHKPVNSSAPRKLKVERRALPSSDEFSTLAANSVSKKHQAAALPRPEESLAWVGENQLAMHSIASVPREILDKSNVTEFVALPQVNTVPMVFIKDADLIKMKKSFEENKGLRQMVRYIINRNIPTLPST